MLDHDRPEGHVKNLPDKIERQLKYATQARFGWGHKRRLGFVFGCQRSGTKMVMRVLERSPLTRIFHENDLSAFDEFELRSVRTIRSLVRITPAPVQVFKPICDSQRARELLSEFPEARGVWVVRDPADVANSAMEKWGAHQREVIGCLVRGELDTWGWRTAQVPDEVVDALRSVWRDDLSDGEGALLWWYLRNALFFAQALEDHERMLVVRYEALVSAPERAFEPLFDHLDVPWAPEHVDRVRSSSIGKRPPPDASPEILALCRALVERFDAWRAPERRLRLPDDVLVLIDTMGLGGAERYALVVANWFAEQGCDVTLSASPGGELAPELRDVRYVPLPVEGVRADLPLRAVQVRRAIGRRPTVIVSNSLATCWLGRLAFPGTPVVNVAHGWPEERFKKVGPMMNMATRVVAVSPSVRGKLVAHGTSPHRVAVVHNGVRMDPLGPREGAVREAAREAMGGHELVVIIVGRLVAQKAHQHVVAVAKALDRPGVGFALVGWGEREGELRALVEAEGVGDRVHLLGPRRDVPELLGAADLYLNCSDWEGMPLTTIEAMGSCLPVVATATEGSEQLLDAGCGLVVPVGDVAAMTAAVRELVDDPERRQAMGAAARERALRHFSHDRMCRGLAEVVAQAVR